MRRKRKRYPIVSTLAAVAVLAVAVWLLLANVVFVVRNVRVEGAGEVPETDVLHLASIRFGARMSAVDEEEIQNNVQSDGRLAFVSLEKRYPSLLVLTVRPRTCDAVILQGGKILILDSEGYVVRVTDQLPDGHVPYVTGLKATYYSLGKQLDTTDGRCLAMGAVLAALKAQGAMPYVSELDVSNTDDIRAITRTGMTVLLGNQENMSNKIIWMAGALADLEARGETGGKLDVSSGTKADYLAPVTAEAPLDASHDGDAADKQTLLTGDQTSPDGPGGEAGPLTGQQADDQLQAGS